ncbi:MAG: mechanosensitive ion channel, partial [Eubacteriales bacterium]|nr:mechanosensitive ion channel [Eubacteriales bacterium]
YNIAAGSAAAAYRAAAAGVCICKSAFSDTIPDISGDVIPEISGEASTIIETIEEADITVEDITVENIVKGIKLVWPFLRTIALNILSALIIYLVGRQVIKLLLKMLERVLKRAQAEPGLTHFILSALGIILNVLLAFIALGQLGINTASIVTIIGAGGLAIVMSLQSSLSNVAGGILILLMKPFRVGDFVSTSSGDGTVTQIGMVYTRLLTPDNRVLTIPNGELANSAVTDVTMLPERRLDLQVGISYKSDLLLGKKLLEEIFEGCPGRIQDKPANVHVGSLGESAVILEIFGYVETSMFLTAKWYMNEQIKLRFDEAGVEIVYPQLDVHLDREIPRIMKNS